MAKTKTTPGTINCKNSSLAIYKTTNSNKKNKIGSVAKGTSIEILQTKVVSGTTWAKIKGSSINTGWVIMKRKGSKTSTIDTSGNASKAKSNKKSKSSKPKTESESDNASGKVSRETTGVVSYNTRQYNTREVTRTAGSINGFKDAKNVTKLSSYEIIYDDNIKKSFNIIRKSINSDVIYTSMELFQRYTRYYNRFKIATPNDTLTKTFAHVFFTRPDLNILKYKGSGNYELASAVKGIDPYAQAFKNNLDVMKQLVISGQYNHDFMLYPSNKIVGFEMRDRNIEADTYGKTLRGHSIAYGKHNVRSKSAGELSLTFSEDKYLHIFNLHNLWVNYISDVYTGRVDPEYNRILNKELDYASSLYYIVTDETGENIIYWAKFYGIFPTTIPDSVMSWSKGQTVTNPEVTISYQYSFQEPYNMETLYELNLNTRNNKKWKYARTYQPDIGGTGTTWVGAPFVEMVPNGGRLELKLRFLEKT